MSNDQTRPHLSASQLETFAKCPEQWRRRYIEKEKIPPRLAMLKGKAVHAGAEHNLRQKIETHEDRPATEIIDAAVANYEAAIAHDGYSLDAGQTKESVGVVKDMVALMAAGHAMLQAPEYQPVAVEEHFRIPLPAITHDLIGVVDLITDKGEVVDLKTAAKPYNKDEVETSTQLTVYAAAKNPTGESNVVLDVLIEPSARNPVRRQRIEASRNKSDLPILARRVAVVAQQINAGLFPPAAVGSWWCSEGWCGYWKTCPYVNAERITASKQVKKAMEILQGENK
jgi:putative RecB family exonuclease